MTSDVPIGAFLSGGVDSTLIATLMQEKSETPSTLLLFLTMIKDMMRAVRHVGLRH